MRWPATVALVALSLSGCRAMGGIAGGIASGLGKVTVAAASGIAKAAPAIASGVGKGLASAGTAVARAAPAVARATGRVTLAVARARPVDYQRPVEGRVYIYDEDDYEPVYVQGPPPTVWGAPPTYPAACWCVFRQTADDTNMNGWLDVAEDGTQGPAYCPDLPVTENGQPYVPEARPDGQPPTCPLQSPQ